MDSVSCDEHNRNNQYAPVAKLVLINLQIVKLVIMLKICTIKTNQDVHLKKRKRKKKESRSRLMPKLLKNQVVHSI